MASSAEEALQDYEFDNAVSLRDGCGFDSSVTPPMSPSKPGYFADFVDVDLGHELYEVDDYTEPLQRYEAGLFYPIRIGDVLRYHTYLIVHKLGHGDSSTVWLARDIQNGKDVALKIMITGNKGEDGYSMQKCRAIPIFSHI